MSLCSFFLLNPTRLKYKRNQPKSCSTQQRESGSSHVLTSTTTCYNLLEQTFISDCYRLNPQSSECTDSYTTFKDECCIVAYNAVLNHALSMWSRTWFEGDGPGLLVNYSCGWRGGTLDTSTSAYPASRCPAWRRPFHRASLESDPLLSPWVTSPPWAEPSCTPPVGRDRREAAWASNDVTDCGAQSHIRSPVAFASSLTILLLISWKWISHTFSTTSSFSNVTNPKPIVGRTSSFNMFEQIDVTSQRVHG